MAATSTSPVKILLDLGIDLDNLSSEENYLSALMEGAAAIESATKGKGDGRSAILREEVVRVRKGRKAADPNFKQRGQSFKITKKNISAQKLLTSSKEAKAQTEGGGDLLVIKEKVVAIEALLGEQYKLQEENAKDAKQEAEKKRRSLKERLLEGSGKVFDGVKKATNTVLKPFKSVWENIIGFIKKIILGRVLMNILKWTSDPENEGKLNSIIKFFEDWWPALLAGYLLFGNSMTKMITGMLIQMAKWVAPMLLAIGKLMLNPWVLAAMGTGAAIYGIHKSISNNKEEGEGDDNIVESENQSDLQITEQDNTNVQKMNKGGQVPGRGNTDTVPAMLTPGEFVMSKGAVQKYGIDTMEGMNAAAGGTNRPTYRRGKSGFNEGGSAIDKSHYGTEGYRIGQVNPDTLLLSRTSYTEKSAETFGKGASGADYDKFNEDVDMNMPGRTREVMKYKSGELVGKETFEEDIAAIGVPDLLEHKDQLLSSINAVPGYENVTIDDVINRKVNMPLKDYIPILMGSDAQAATFAKMDAAHEMDLQSRGITDPSKGYSMGYNGGGLVQGFQGGGSVGFFKGMGNIMGGKKWSGESRAQIGRSVSKSSNITPPVNTAKVTVINQPGTEQADASQAQLPPAGNREIPSFDATMIRSSHKMEVLGISA